MDCTLATKSLYTVLSMYLNQLECLSRTGKKINTKKKRGLNIETNKVAHEAAVITAQYDCRAFNSAM